MEFGSHGDHGAARLVAGATAARATEELRTAMDHLTAEGRYDRREHHQAFAVPLADETPAPPAGGRGGRRGLDPPAPRGLRQRREPAPRPRRRPPARAGAAGRGRRRPGPAPATAARRGSRARAPGDGGGPAARPGDAPRPVLDGRRAGAARGRRVDRPAGDRLRAAARGLHHRRLRARSRARGPPPGRGGDAARGRAALGRGASHRRWRRAVVVAQAALAALLAVGAGLMARSLDALGRIDIGFELRGAAHRPARGSRGPVPHAGGRRPLLPLGRGGGAGVAWRAAGGPPAGAPARRVDRRFRHRRRGLRRDGERPGPGGLASGHGGHGGDARRAPGPRPLPAARRRRGRPGRRRDQRGDGATLLGGRGPDRAPVPDRLAAAAVGHCGRDRRRRAPQRHRRRGQGEVLPGRTPSSTARGAARRATWRSCSRPTATR